MQIFGKLISVAPLRLFASNAKTTIFTCKVSKIAEPPEKKRTYRISIKRKLFFMCPRPGHLPKNVKYFYMPSKWYKKNAATNKNNETVSERKTRLLNHLIISINHKLHNKDEHTVNAMTYFPYIFCFGELVNWRLAFCPFSFRLFYFYYDKGAEAVLSFYRADFYQNIIHITI